ncbi:MAG TPA: TPM domain-containing protein [Pyrinomonadaceae bacterium]|nr:TPM domain-containing protein [Pyrinomonadaceae bacterium]
MRVFALCLCLVTATVISCNRVSNTANPSVLKASDYVTDDAKVIDDATKKQLETTLAALKERTKIDFSVVTVKTTGDKSAFDYSLELARARKDKSFEQNVSGLLLLIAVDDRTWHIQITRNLEVQLTKEILTNLSVPMSDSFKQNRYSEGILKYVNAIIARLEPQKAQKTQKIVNHQC